MSNSLGESHNETYKSLLARIHKDLQIIPNKGGNYPCIITSLQIFERFLSTCKDTPASSEVTLDILRDGTGNVLVDVKFLNKGGTESFLIDAAKNIQFFQALADSSVIAIMPKHEDSRMFAVQLPKPDAIADALEKITQGLKKNS